MLWLLLQLCAFLISLMVIGEPIRILFLRSQKLFKDLDFLQICLLDVYLGGLALYVIAILPLQLFSWAVALGLTIFGFLFTVSFHLRSLHKRRIQEIHLLLAEHRTAVIDYTLLVAIFLILLWIQLPSLEKFVFGSVHDTSLHSLMVQVILESHHVPVTLQPYLPEGIVYPQASHVLFAYASYLLNYEAPRAVFYVTPLFNSLSVFGVYFFGRQLWNNRSFYLGLSFVSAFVSSWPLYVTWGANPFVTGFPLFLICLGLFSSLSSFRRETNVKELVAVGLLFGYSAVLILSFLETLLVIGILWLVYGYLRKSGKVRSMTKRYLLIFLFSLIPLSPFLVRFIMYYQYPGGNVGIAPGFMGQEKLQLKLTQALEWAFENLNPNTLLGIELIGLLFGFGVLLWKVGSGDKKAKKVLFFATAIFLSSTLLSFVSYFLPANLTVISWPHQSIILTLSISIFVVVFYQKLVIFLRNIDFRGFGKVFSKRSYAPLLISVAALAAINGPFVYSRLAIDPQTLVGSYGWFAITTEDDYDLMRWMETNLPKNSTILVSPYEAGLFIPSISHLKIVFPYVASQRTYNYQRIVNLLSQNTVNGTSFELMQYYNITHIFVGTYAIYWWMGNYKWNAQVFLGNPNFKLAKRFGNSYLFEFSLSDPTTVLLDEFDYENLTDYGWELSGRGVGLGEATAVSLDGESRLMLNATSKASGQTSPYFYELQLSRQVYLAEVSDTLLSFCLNASSGFSQLDAVAISVSNIWSNLSLCFTTPDGIFQILKSNQTKTFTIASSGNFTFNLSQLWLQAYGSDLPDTLLLQIRNFDVDGVPNVAFLDSLKVFYQGAS
jgi:hypothetical protein